MKAAQLEIDPMPGRQRSATAPSVPSELSLSDLPPANTVRWTPLRKAQVVTAFRTGLITLDDACERYNLSVEELMAWQRLVDAHGVRGLRSTRIQRYRRELAVAAD